MTRKRLAAASSALALLSFAPVAANALPAAVTVPYAAPYSVNPNFPNFKAAVANVLSNTADGQINFIGDSMFAGVNGQVGGVSFADILVQSMPARFTKLLQNTGINASNDSTWGDQGSSNGGNTLSYFDNRVNLNSCWTYNTLSYYGAGGKFMQPNACTAAFTFTPIDGQLMDTVDIYYTTQTAAGAYGVFNVSVNGVTCTGGSWAGPYNTNAASAFVKSTCTFTPAVNPVVSIIPSSGAPLIAGLELRNSTTHRMLVRNFGCSGCQSNIFVNTGHAWQWPNTITTYGGSLTVQALTVNDTINGVSLATSLSNLTSILTYEQSHNDTLELTLIPYSASSEPVASQIALNNVLKIAANGLGVPVLDENARFGSYANGLLNGFDYAAELVHPSFLAYQDEAQFIYNYIMSYAPQQAPPTPTFTTASIGGSALAAGACTSGTVSVPGAATTSVASANPNTYPGAGITWNAQITATGTVTVYVCASVAATPTSSTFNVRVTP